MLTVKKHDAQTAPLHCPIISVTPGLLFECLIATLAKCGPLDFPSENIFLLFFAHGKGLGHMFQKSFSCSPILFFCVATSQKWFLARPPLWTAIEGVNFKDFVQRAATATMLLTEFSLATSYKVYSVSSEETVLFDLNLHIKKSLLFTKELSKCRR